MTPKELLKVEREFRKNCFKLLRDPNIKNAPKDKLLKLEEDFMSGFDEIFESLNKQNESISQTQAKELLPRMYQKITDKFKSVGYETIQEFSEDFNRLIVSYLDNTRDPENYIILENFITTKVMEDLDNILQVQTDKMIVANQEMQQKIISDETLIEDLK